MNSVGADNNTALHHACFEADMRVAVFLLQQGADLFQLNSSHETPYDLTRRLSDKDMLYQTFISCNQQFADQLAFHGACERGDLSLVRESLAVRNVPLEALDRDGYTGLYLAVDCQKYEVTRVLLETGAVVDTPSLNGRIPLHAACSNGDLKTVKLLLDSGSAVTTRDIRGSTPLHMSSEGGYVYISKLLIDRGADVNSLDGTHSSPLHLATANRHVLMASFLIEHGAAVDAVGLKGCTPLYNACQEGDMEIACMLIEKGADMWRTNALGENPIQAVVDKANKRLMYDALGVSMKSKEKGYERWKRRKAFVTFLSCYSMRLMATKVVTDGTEVDSTSAVVMADPRARPPVVAVFKSRDLVRFIAKYL